MAEADDAIPAECGKLLSVSISIKQLLRNGNCTAKELRKASVFAAKAGLLSPPNLKFSFKPSTSSLEGLIFTRVRVIELFSVMLSDALRGN
jgi:hypothetical protein